MGEPEQGSPLNAGFLASDVSLSAVCMLQHIQCQAVSKGTSAGYKPVHGRFLSCLMLMFNLLTCSEPTDLG